MREDVIRAFMIRMGIEGGYRTRDWLNFHCPFAEHTHRSQTDKSASFGIQVNKKGSSRYWCFSCRESGRLYELPINLGKHGIGEGSDELMAQIISAETELGFGLFEEIDNVDAFPEPLGRAYDNLYDPVTGYPDAMEFLAGRGVTADAAVYMKLAFDTDEQRVVFPVYGDRGEIYGYTGRSILPPSDYSIHYPKQRDYLGLQKKHMLLNIQNFQKGQRIALMEGPLDVARSVSNGALDMNICPVGLLGASLSTSKIETLLHAAAPVYLILDNDEAGDLGIYGKTDDDGKRDGRGAYDILSPDMPVGVPDYPEGANDPGELTSDQFRQMIEETSMTGSLCDIPKYF